MSTILHVSETDAQVKPEVPRAAAPKLARPAWIMWAVFAAGIAASVLLRNDSRSVTHEYARAAMLWWQGHPMYTEGVHGFLYLPQAAMLYTPMTWLPDAAAEIIWRFVGLALLVIGLRRMTGRFFESFADLAFLIATPLVIISALGSAANGQTNIHLAALFALCCVDLIDKKWWRVAIWLMLALACKPTAVVMILLVGAIYLRPMWWRMPIALAVFAVLPFAHPNPAYVSTQYRDCITKMSGASQPGDAFQDIRGMLIEFGVVHVEKVAATAEHAATVVQTPPESVLTFVRAIAALLTLGLCVIGARRFGDLGRAVILYTLGGIYLTLFNPRTEGLSYIILGLPAALWSVRELRDRRWWTAAFFIFFALSTQFSTQIALKHKNYWVRPLGAAVFAALIVVEVSRRSSRWDQRDRSTAPSACG